MKKVLIIDDLKSARSVLKKIITSLGEWHVVEAENGEEGLEQMKRHHPIQLVFVDWNMPVINGLEFIKKVKVNQEWSSCKIIMVTTETELTQVSDAIKYGADEYIMKPVMREIVSSKLEILGLWSPNGEEN